MTAMAAARFPEVEGLAQHLYDLLQAPCLFNVEEVGVFNAVAPSPQDWRLQTAVQTTSQHVGLASWALNPLYLSCKRRLYKGSKDIVAATAMLIASPDFLTAWNVRKTVFRPGDLRAELHFSYLVLTRSPKCAEAWAHRHWLIRSVSPSCVHADAELRLAWLAASRTFSNYYATVHRIRFIPTLDIPILLSELCQSRLWLRTHVSDSSGWTYHRALVTRLLELQALVQNDEDGWFAEISRHYRSIHQNITTHARWLAIKHMVPPAQSPEPDT